MPIHYLWHNLTWQVWGKARVQGAGRGQPLVMGSEAKPMKTEAASFLAFRLQQRDKMCHILNGLQERQLTW